MTTNYDAEEVLVGGACDVYVSDIGTAFPTATTGDPAAGWTHLGYTSEAGIKQTLRRTIADINASQAFYAVRRIVTKIELTVDFELEQWNSENILVGLGGGDIESVGGGDFKYVPPAESFVDERQLLLHVVDGDRIYRWGYTRVQNTKDFTTDLTRTGGSFIPIGMTVLDPGTADSFFFITNDPAVTAAS